MTSGDTLAILVGGGPAPGINGVIASATIEAINNGFLPQDAVDALDAARFLKDNEEYWPFEGDDWPDEFVGGESK